MNTFDTTRVLSLLMHRLIEADDNRDATTVLSGLQALAGLDVPANLHPIRRRAIQMFLDVCQVTDHLPDVSGLTD